MKVSDPNLYEGWARLVAQEHSKGLMPAWVAKSIHPDCERPTHVWAMLVGIQRERQALFDGERMPREVMGFPTATMDQAIGYLERQAQNFAAALAWGSSSDEW